MSMTYSSLIASKGSAGAIATWVSYDATKLDVVTIVDEAQPLIYSLLRTREMRTSMQFSMDVNNSYVALPARFLDPIGRIYFSSFNTTARHKDSNYIEQARTYEETSGTLGTNPFTTTNGSNTVSVALTSHGFSQASVFNTSGATAFNGVTIAGTFPITGITDANDFTIDISSLGTTPSGSGAGGGTAVDYLCDNLNDGIPQYWGIWDERIQFEMAFYQQSLCKLQYYQSLPLLSSTNLSNFLCTRYPSLLRTACMAAAADFMQDTEEYNKLYQRLVALVERTAVDNDGEMRGMELETLTP